MKTEVSYTKSDRQSLTVKMSTQAGTEISISGPSYEEVSATMFVILREFVEEPEARGLMQAVLSGMEKLEAEHESVEVAG